MLLLNGSLGITANTIWLWPPSHSGTFLTHVWSRSMEKNEKNKMNFKDTSIGAEDKQWGM